MSRHKTLLIILSLSTLGLAALALVLWRQVKNFSGIPVPPAGPKRRHQESTLRSAYTSGW